MLSQILEMDENILAALILLIGLAIAYWIYGPKQQPYVVKTLDSNSSKIGGNNKNVKNTSSTSSSTTSKTSATSKSSVEKRSDKHLSLFFGSQTGTAEDFARTIAKDAKAMGFKTAVIDLEDYSAESDIQREGLCMFFMATYGEGEPTDNAKEFYEWLEACEDSLSNISYSVFGLGNKTYEHYNNIGKNVDKWLEERGATRLAPVGLGDDDMSLEDDFAEWRVNALAPFAAKAGIAVKADDAGKGKRAKFVPSFVLQKYAADSSEAKQAAAREKTDTGGLGVRALDGEALRSSKHDSFDARQPLCAYIAVNRELHSDKSDRSCRHIEIETNGLLKYEAGDHVGVFAENTADDVEKLAQRLKLDLDEVVSLDEPADDRREAHSIVGPATLRHIFTRLLEINGQIRQATVGALAEFASDAKEKATLQGWADDTDSYMKQCKDACRTVPQLLDEMPSLNPPLAVLLELLPRLAPRYYSLSSSPSVHGTRLHVTCVVVQHKTSTGRLLNGLCSSWFARVAGVPDQPVACFVRKSNFRLPAQLDVPMLMFGPGTGIAPFRGFLHELRARRESAATAPPSNIVLYYGCRRIDTDSLYIDELRSFRDDGTTRRIYVAESRLEPDEQPLEIHFPGDDLIEEHADKPRPKYVQHLLSRLADSKRAADMLQQPGAHVYICGDARYMAKDVHEALRLAIAGDVEPNTEQLKKADDLLALLSKEGRYQKDVWY